MMNKQKLLLLALSMVGSTMLYAQPEPGTFSMTHRFGFSASTFVDEPTLYLSYKFYNQLPTGMITEGGRDRFINATKTCYQTKYVLGITRSFDVQWHNSEHWAFVTGLGYSLQGSGYEQKNYDLLSNGWGVKDIQVRMFYLTVPVMAKLYIGHGFALNGGLQLNILCRANLHCTLGYCCEETGTYYISLANKDLWQDLEADVAYETRIKCKINDYYKPLELSVPLGLSYEYGHYVFDLRANMGVTKMTEDFTSKEEANGRNLSFTFTLGCRLDYKRK